MSGSVAPNSSVDLASLSDLQTWLSALGLPSVPSTELQLMVTAMSNAIETWLGYNPIQSTYTATFDGRGTNKVAFPNGPVTAVSALSIDNLTIPAATDQIMCGYLFNTTTPYQSWLSLRGYKFWKGVQNCSVSYTAGFTAGNIPASLTEACLEAIGALSQVASREPGLIEEKVGGLEERYVSPTAAGARDLNSFVLTPSITFALVPLRRVVPAW